MGKVALHDLGPLSEPCLHAGQQRLDSGSALTPTHGACDFKSSLATVRAIQIKCGGWGWAFFLKDNDQVNRIWNLALRERMDGALARRDSEPLGGWGAPERLDSAQQGRCGGVSLTCALPILVPLCAPGPIGAHSEI